MGQFEISVSRYYSKYSLGKSEVARVLWDKEKEIAWAIVTA